MKKLFLAALVCCMTILAFAEAGPICDGLLGKENGTGADVPARVKWTTDTDGNVDITILPYSKAEETADKPTRWRGRGMADNLTADQGWEMTIDGEAAVLADYFDKNYTTNSKQAEAPSVYQLEIKNGKQAELAGKTVVIKKTTKGSNICWWTPRGNNGYGKATFEYLYGSECEEVTLSAPTNVSIDNNVLTFDDVTGADSYAANIYLDGMMLKSIADINSGDTLPRLMLTGATFQVKVVAKAGAVESEESVAADWVVANAQIEEIGTSEYCEEIIGQKVTEQAGMTWQTDENGDIHITISGEGATWRGTAFKGIAYFWVGECPASYFFEEQYKQDSTVYSLHLKDTDKAPIAGETISFKGTMQWRTATADNAYAENVTLAYTYKANCAGLDTPTNVAVNAEGVITFDPVVGATNYVVTIYKGIHPIAIYTNISSGDTLPFVAIETGTYNVTVYAQGDGALDSHESDPCDWQLTGTGWAPTKSTVCGVQYESDTYEENPYKVEDSYMEISVQTENGDIVITISPVIEGDNVTFRNNDALGLASFSTNGVPLVHYFTTNSKTLETRYVLNPKADRSLPYGSEILYNGTFQWATVGNPNSYKHNVSFTYIYGSVCEDQNDSTSINDIKQTVSAHKTIVNGHLYIISGERTYDAQGREIR